MRAGGLLGTGILASAACRSKDKGPLTTLEATISLLADGTLAPAPGEPYTVRTDLGQAQSDREKNRRSFAVFHHLSDFRILDEESPLRSEWVEACSTPLAKSAFRPQESLSLQAADGLIVAANRIDRSPVGGRRVDFAVHTGNAVDNAQYNELRWFIDLMDGKAVNPDSGGAGYQGVQKGSPSSAYPDLLEAAQRSFSASGLSVPWYSVIGNRDVLVQGNFAQTPGATTIALGSEKIISLGPQSRGELCQNPNTLLGPDSSQNVLSDPQSVVENVTPDPGRRLLPKREWVAEHLTTADAPGPPGHGFSSANLAAETAYYLIEHGIITFIVLDTANPGGFSTGSIDAVQFSWLEERLKERSSTYFEPGTGRKTTGNADRLIIIVSHHAVDTMTNPFPGANNEVRARGPQLESLLHRFPNVILHVAGHSQVNHIVARTDPSGTTKGYWQITTPAPLDYPMQGRLIEIADNGDGTLSILATVYDSAAPLVPGNAEDPTPADEVNELLLASVARLVAVSDPQLDSTAAGLAPSDRNAELLLDAPFALSGVAVPPRHNPAADDRRMSRRALFGLAG